MSISKVVVVDGNNLTVRIDRGVAGRSVTDVQAVEINNALFLVFTFSDGTTETVGPVGVIQYVGTAPIVVDGINISLTTVPVNLGGTGQVTANDGFNALAPAQAGNANKYLKSDGTNAAWDLLDISTADITGVLPIANGGTNATTAAGARASLNAADQDTTISAGTGLSGGGSLAANRTLSITNTAVTAGSYGSASNTLSATVNAQGQLTALSAAPIAIANTQVSGLGTASVLNAGSALGVATLDAGGTVPLSQIPASIQGGVSYQGSWNAATNTPTLTSSVGQKGYYYVVAVAGNTNLNGITDWLPGDWAIYNGTAWEKIDNTDSVASVNGYVGVVVLNAADVGAPPTTRTVTAGTGLTGGGDLSANRTFDISNTAVTAGSYGSASAVPSITVNAQGQLTAATNTTIAITNTQVSGLGTMSTQNADTVAITGGTATLTSLTVNDNTTLGSSNTDDVVFNARIASEFTPATDNAFDLGNSGREWRDLFIDGTANIDSLVADTADINGGTIDATSVGATTPATGAFTTLTASGAVTLSGGTANGVAFLNASKVLTTGSALTFDGTNFSVGGTADIFGRFYTRTIGFTSNGSTVLQINGTSYSGIDMGAAGTRTFGLTASATDVNFTSLTNIPLLFGVNSAEQMRLTSTGLGIGTSSPAEKLDVNGSAKFAGSYVSFNNNGYIRTDAANILRFQPGSGGYEFRNAGNSENLAVITSAGDVGIGTSSPSRKLSVVGSGVFTDGTNDLTLYNDGSVGTNGNLNLKLVTNGTVKATLDTSGNLGLGVTPSAWFSNRSVLQIGNSVGVIAASGLNFDQYTNSYIDAATVERYYQAGPAAKFSADSGSFKWLNAASGAANAAITFTQAMTLDASGNLGVGNTSPNVAGYTRTLIVDAGAGNYSQLRLSANNGGDITWFSNSNATQIGQIAMDSTSGATPNMLFRISGSERARITSGGQLLVGKTSPSFSTTGIEIKPTGELFVNFASNNAPAGIRRDDDGAVLNFFRGASNVGSISVTTVLTAYNTTSDYRLKTVIGPVANAGQRIDALQPVEYTWNASGERTRGFLAHQFQEVYAGSVSGTKDAVDAEGKPVYQAMQASTSEVIADLVAEIQNLRARVAQLESN